jgi:hypothetical protein
MPAIQLLVVADRHEIDRLQLAAAAAGGTVLGVDEHDDFTALTRTFRPDAVIVAGGGVLRDPRDVVRRLRAATGARTPIVFAGEARAAMELEGLVDAAFPRPVGPETLVSRALALILRPRAAPRDPRPAAAPRLREVATSIDEALEAEMLSALQAALGPVPGVPAVSDPAGNGPDLPGSSDMARPEQDEVPGWTTGAAPATNDRQGDLADVDLPMLLGWLFAAGTTGRLVVGEGPVEKAVYVEAGRPVFATSSSPDESLIELRVRNGLLTHAQYQMARAAQDSGRTMGAVLVDLGLIEASELLPVIREHHEELVLSLFAWTEGPWRWEAGVRASPSQIRLLRHPGALVRAGLRREYPRERIWRRLGSSRNVFVLEIHGATSAVIDAIADDPAERLILLLFDGIRSLDEVMSLGGLPEDTFAEITLAAWALGLVGPAAEPGLRSSMPARAPDIQRERALARHALALDGDYFEVLGLSRHASMEEIHRAFDHVSRELTPAALGTELAGALRQEIDIILEVLEEALRVLGTESLRIRYQAALPPERSFDRNSRRSSTSLAQPSGGRPGMA